MSGETEKQISGWTVDTLKEHLLALRDNDKEALKLALDSADKAVNKAEEAQLRVNESQNEFRGALKDQASTLLPRGEYDAKHESLQKEVDGVKRLVFIGLGVFLAVQFIIAIFVGVIE